MKSEDEIWNTIKDLRKQYELGRGYGGPDPNPENTQYLLGKIQSLEWALGWKNSV